MEKASSLPQQCSQLTIIACCLKSETLTLSQRHAPLKPQGQGKTVGNMTIFQWDTIPKHLAQVNAT